MCYNISTKGDNLPISVDVVVNHIDVSFLNHRGTQTTVVTFLQQIKIVIKSYIASINICFRTKFEETKAQTLKYL